MCCAVFEEELDHFREELDVSAVVAGNPDGSDILLNGGSGYLVGAAVIAEVDDFDAMMDQFLVDRVDGAVMAVADGDGGEDSDWNDLHLHDPLFSVTLSPDHDHTRRHAAAHIECQVVAQPCDLPLAGRL